jgi:hypothetical protein
VLEEELIVSVVVVFLYVGPACKLDHVPEVVLMGDREEYLYGQPLVPSYAQVTNNI